ncbi:DNL-type zinc finger protein-like [Strongylocentrotus purpuratus]|uniref:DNL-type domain-containing protein n=1 Tax=Strongylocentrotus purpuratus TaxID=7668 RepID=A0A7M7HLQ0_STRPU|nr:DNL-type zinc finger protein-like [Strongylocentrotus purpuratus]|eukprot:XP_011670866.1 PREDICTED: DNL-type zinc finger protein-like [Strongylocentrotus purpuratus]
MLRCAVKAGVECCPTWMSRICSRTTSRMKVHHFIRPASLDQRTVSSSSSSSLVWRRIKTDQKNSICRPTDNVLTSGLKACFCSGQSDDGSAAKQALGKIEGKLHLAFTCKVCGMRTARSISKHAYEKGVVIVKCSGCENNHLIADNLDWFKGAKGAGRNIEEIMAAKGENIRSQVTKDDMLEISSLDTDTLSDEKT